MAARIPWSSGTPGGSAPAASSRPPREVRVASGLRPMKLQRLHRSPCSTDSSRKPLSSPTRRANADTGVVKSASTSRHTGITVWSRASARNSSRLGTEGHPKAR